MSTDITRASAAEIADVLARREASAAESQTHLDRIAPSTAGPRLPPRRRRGALCAARDIDRRRAAGEELHVVAGVPIAVKDVMAAKACRPPAARRSSRAGSRPTTPRW